DGEVPRIGPGSPAAKLETVEEEFEVDAPAAEAAAAEADQMTAPKRPTDKEIEEGGGDSMLARYFREMATHPVMGSDEELQTAIGVEKAEIDHWLSILVYVPTAAYAIESLEKDLPIGEDAIELPQLAEVHKLLKTAHKQRGKLTRPHEK